MGVFKELMKSNKMFVIFIILLLIFLIPFLIVSLTLAYQNRQQNNDYCLSYAGMKMSGIHGVTLRDWLKIDGFGRLIFLVIAIGLLILFKYFRDHSTLINIFVILFILYFLFMLGWMVFGAVIFWGNVQKTVIFQQIPTINNIQSTFGINMNQLIDQKHYVQLQRVALLTSNDYSYFNRFDRQQWFHQDFLASWPNYSGQNQNAWLTYQQAYAKDNQPRKGFRYGCKGRVSAYMYILLILSFILIPVFLLLLLLAKKKATYHRNDEFNHQMHERPVEGHRSSQAAGVHNLHGPQRFSAQGPNYDAPESNVRLR